MPPPQLMNQPPQIFGSYAHHDGGMPVLPPEIAAQMAFDPTGLLEDPNDAKRRRIARVSQEIRPPSSGVWPASVSIMS